MIPLFCSEYLPPVSHIMAMASAGEVCVEQYDNYLKQTYRNRCVIATADGTQTLTIPVVKSDEPKQLMRDVRISDHGNWRHLHWNAISSAYMNSPFFLYYEEDFRHLFDRKYDFLMDFNMDLLRLVVELAGMKILVSQSSVFVPFGQADTESDFRWMVGTDADVSGFNPEPYYQVFAQKNGFIPNLSIIDLLFNMGPETLLVLKKQNCPPVCAQNGR